MLALSNFVSHIKVPISFAFVRCYTNVATAAVGAFFDNTEKQPIGRSWSASELRLKSHDDLHKLWYVLLREKNMLLTKKADYHRHNQRFPEAHRLIKVKKSMARLLFVEREREIAYNQAIQIISLEKKSALELKNHERKPAVAETDVV